jgi:hypothetical protein
LSLFCRGSILELPRLLIISPHFPPVNAADMHRVRHMLPYLKDFGWEADVIAVDPACIEAYSIDSLLLKTIPSNISIHYIKAFPASFTRRFGLGNLALRGLWQMMRKGNELLKEKKFDLIFFSTTAFNFMPLGVYWKRKFKIPFILDIQDPWRNDYYLSQPKSKRPPKFYFSYILDKYFEAITIPKADGIISVSPDYIQNFKIRYKHCARFTTVIPFAGYKEDINIARELDENKLSVQLHNEYLNIVYIGRGGHDLEFSLSVFFQAFRKGLMEKPDVYERIRCWFIGTSYAPKGMGKKTILPVANTYSVGQYVYEMPDRLPFYETLATLMNADVLFIPGSMDKGYTASKIYPYILAEKPLLACFHINSTVIDVLKTSPSAQILTYETNELSMDFLVADMYQKLNQQLTLKGTKCPYDTDTFKKYSAPEMTKAVLHFFEQVIK